MPLPKLDPKSLLVEEFTSVDPICIDAEETLDHAKNLMIRNNIRHIPIIANGFPVGIISERQINTLPMETWGKRKAMEIMVDKPFCVPHTDLLKDVVFQMSKKKIGSALVVNEEGRLYGIFTSIDALNVIIECL